MYLITITVIRTNRAVKTVEAPNVVVFGDV